MADFLLLWPQSTFVAHQVSTQVSTHRSQHFTILKKSLRGASANTSCPLGFKKPYAKLPRSFRELTRNSFEYVENTAWARRKEADPGPRTRTYTCPRPYVPTHPGQINHACGRAEGGNASKAFAVVVPLLARHMTFTRLIFLSTDRATERQSERSTEHKTHLTKSSNSHQALCTDYAATRNRPSSGPTKQEEA